MDWILDDATKLLRFFVRFFVMTNHKSISAIDRYWDVFFYSTSLIKGGERENDR